MDHKFQINLRGIIDLLSNHLYSGPQVFLRELLQNGVDAIRARQKIDPGYEGEIAIEIVRPAGGVLPTLIFADTGIGLTEAEIHRFLATIGESSKRGDLSERRSDFLGQFGIGLLSCFMVCDEIVLVTRSAAADEPAIEWHGRPNGTYSIQTSGREIAPGTQVFLRAREDSTEYFDPERVRELAEHFGAMLPDPIYIGVGDKRVCINETPPPWRREFVSASARREALMAFGREAFSEDFFDCIPLRSKTGRVEGAAYVLSHSPNLAARQAHRVYLKNMLLTERADNLLPDWAFFVRCIVNAEDLRPTASREGFYEDMGLLGARESLGECLRDYLVGLSERDPERLVQLILLHHRAIKALAVHDDEFYRLFIDWLPFETSLGTLSMGEYRSKHKRVRYVETRDQFRQIAAVAASQSLCVINGGYVYDAELIERMPELFPEMEIECIDPSSLARGFQDLAPSDRSDRIDAFLLLAGSVLNPLRCGAEIKTFEPAEMPALYTVDSGANYLRSVEQSREIADGLWSSILDSVAPRLAGAADSLLCFNYASPLVRKLVQLRDEPLLRRMIEMLYVQALLLGHHPLSAKEMRLLNDGLIGLIEWSIDERDGKAE